jgi:hypothetical protein
MALRRRLVARGCVLAAVTTSIGLWAAGEDPSPGTRSERQAPRDAASGANLAAPSEVLHLRFAARTLPPQPANGLFEARSWEPPPPPPLRPRLIAPEPELEDPPPPAPVAPPLPFTFLGAFKAEGGKRVLYLVEGDRVHAVSEGEMVNELYQVEAVGENEMVFVYLPLKARQSLALGAGT